MRSQFERTLAKELNRLKIRYEYEAYEFEYYDPITYQNRICANCGSMDLFSLRTYTPDFYLPKYNLFLEAKGKWTAQGRRQFKAVIDQHPNENFHIIFMRDNKLSRNSKYRYSTYCDKYNINYSIATIPKGI